MSEQKKTIRFEDLGEPVQKLLKRVKGVTEEDMALFEFVSVKDMAKIYQEMGTDREAEDIWDELKGALLARREKAEKKRRELARKEAELNADAEADEQARLAEEAAAAEEAEARRKRKEERRRRRAEQQAAEEEQARLDAEEAEAAEQERLAQEEAERKAEAKRRRREAKKRAQEEELAAIEEERQREAKKKSKNIKAEWEDYKAAHPLEFANDLEQEIQQVSVKRSTKAPPSADFNLLTRTYTPQCPNCHARFSKPPKEWDCPMCLRRYRKRFKCWQPDEATKVCMVSDCNIAVGRFSRHHCRNCGRVVCSECTKTKALIPSVGFDETPVKCCRECLVSLASMPSPSKDGEAAPAADASPSKQAA